MVKGRDRLLALVGAGALIAAGVACNGVLGIDSAAVDPTFGLDAGTDTGAADPCTSYCNAVVTNCPHDEYNDVPTCLALCGAFDRGQSTDTSQDSLGCRAHYAALAATDPSNCPAAGPLGGGVCGNDVCNTFCALDSFACTGANSAFDGGQIGCGTACEANFPIYLTDAGNDLALSTGNTLNCRIWHLEAAVDPAEGAGALAMHCPHTAVVSAFCH
jgi:hypothetical protein